MSSPHTGDDHRLTDAADRRRSPLVGRRRELLRLHDVIGAVAGGSPAAVLISGPSGIGTTRLGHECLASAARSGFSVVRGHANPLMRDAAYAPLVEALAPVVRASSRPDRLLDGLDALGLVFSGSGRIAHPPPPLGDPGLERTRLADALASLLDRLARVRPLALMIDDATHLDDASLGALRYAVPLLADRPALLVFTVTKDDRGDASPADADPAAATAAAMPGRPGDDDAAEPPPLAGGRALDDLLDGAAAAAWMIERVDPQPLDAAEASALIRHVSGRAVDEALAVRVARHCAGRPQLIEAVARSLSGTPDGSAASLFGADALGTGTDALPLPQAIGARLAERMLALPEDERSVLRVLALAGGLEADLVQEACGLETERLIAVIAHLERAGLVAERPDRVLEPVHGVLRDTVVAGLGAIEEGAVHARLARAFARRDEDDARVAEHVRAAGRFIDARSAIPALLRGADRASGLGAPEDAERLLTEAARRVGETGEPDTEVRILDALAAARRSLGRVDEARVTWTRCLDLATSVGDPRACVRVERALAALDWDEGRLDDARSRLARARDRLSGMEPSGALAEVVHAQAVNAVRIGDTTALRHATSELGALAARLHDPVLAGRAKLAEGALAFTRTDYRRAARLCADGLAMVEGHGDVRLEMRAHDQLSVIASSQGDIATFRAQSTASLALAQSQGSAVLAGWPRLRVAAADLLSGDSDAALRGTSEIIARIAASGEQRGAISAFAVHAWVLAHLGRYAQARSSLAEAVSAARPNLSRDRNVYVMAEFAAAFLAAAEERRARPGLDIEGGAPGELGVGWLPLLSAAVRAEAAARAGFPERALAAREAVLAVRSCSSDLAGIAADWVTAAVIVWGASGPDAHERGEARRLLDACAAGFDGLGLPYWSARASAIAARISDPEEAAPRARRALEGFERVGARAEARRIRELLRAVGGAVRESGPGTGHPLSERELQVARLVAAGMSNARIADSLFISPRTVTTHLDRMYRRLGLGSRVALTRYLIDSGLLEEAVAAGTGDDVT